MYVVKQFDAGSLYGTDNRDFLANVGPAVNMATPRPFK